MGDIRTLSTKESGKHNKLVELHRKYIILEKMGSTGEIRILPRSFDEMAEALEYLGEVDEAMKNSPSPVFRAKNISYYMIPATLVDFLR